MSGVGRTFSTPSGERYTAVKDVNIDIAPGRFVSIVGPSGCGKSTVLNMAAGLMVPSSGHIRTFGESVKGRNRHASYMFQQDGLLPWKTVLDNVTLGLRLRSVSNKVAREQGREWLSRIGLSRVEDCFPHQLSGGMRKRVSIAQSWIVDPRIILMDEPFSALDVQTRKLMEDELLSLWTGSEKTVVFITHDLEEAVALSDEVLLMSAGPEATVVARYDVPLPRPRHLLDIRTTDQFQDLYNVIWARLRDEVMLSYERNSA